MISRPPGGRTFPPVTFRVRCRGSPGRRRVTALAARFDECGPEKNSTLTRNDIVVGLRDLHRATGDETITRRAAAPVETEDDLKYRREYEKSWRQ